MISLINLNAIQFEELCFELIYASDFYNIQWRKGGADKGRDIQAKKRVVNKLVEDYFESWFFECKKYKHGVPPEDLNSKIAWADAEKPNHLVFITSSYLTTACKDWLDKIKPSKPYNIHIIEGTELLKKLDNHPKLVRVFFESHHMTQLVDEARKNWVLHGFLAEASVISTVLESKFDFSKFSNENITFLICSYYFHFEYINRTKDYLRDFDDARINDLISELASRKGKNSELISATGKYHLIGDTGVDVFDDEEPMDFHAIMFQKDKAPFVSIYFIKKLNNSAVEIIIDCITSLNCQHRLIEKLSKDYYERILTKFYDKPEYVESIIIKNIKMI